MLSQVTLFGTVTLPRMNILIFLYLRLENRCKDLVTKSQKTND